jgi:hypothetical protein
LTSPKPLGIKLAHKDGLIVILLMAVHPPFLL